MTFLSYMRLLSAGVVAANLAAVPVLAGDIKRVNFSAGQRLSFVLPDTGDASKKTRGPVLAGLTALAGQGTLTQVYNFAVDEVLIGEHQPQALSLYAWSSADDARQARASEHYKSELASLMPATWSEVHTVEVDLVEPLTLELDSDKTYTLALAWIRSEAMFEGYAALSAPLREVLGAKPLINLPVGYFAQMGLDEADSPDRLVLMEWRHESHPEAYRTSALIQENAEVVGQAFEKIQWYRLAHGGNN